MATIDLSDLITKATACIVLSGANGSLATLLDGIAVQLDANPSPADLAAALRANGRDLVAACTIGTSHIAVAPNDALISFLRRFLEAPPAKRAAVSTAVQTAVQSAGV